MFPTGLRGGPNVRPSSDECPHRGPMCLRAEESSCPSSVGVNGHLQMAEQFRSVLHLIDDERRRVISQKLFGVEIGLFRRAWQVEADVGVVGKRLPQQGSLPGLAGAGEHHGREMLSQQPQSWLNFP